MAGSILLTVLRNAVLLALVDAPYLLLVAPMFRSMISSIQGSALQFRLVAALPVYLALGYLLTLAGSVQQAALLGAATYAVYDFTNYATLKGYTLQFGLIDTAWGGTLFAIAFKVLQVLGLL